MNKNEAKYRQSELEEYFQKLISDWPELIELYNKEVIPKYEANETRLPYIDIGEISRFIVDKKISEQTGKFEMFFENVEEVLIHGDHYVKELMIIGLFEGIQNIGADEIDYYHSFDQWLKQESLKAWRELIDAWEGTDWRGTTESNKILKRKK